MPLLGICRTCLSYSIPKMSACHHLTTPPGPVEYRHAFLDMSAVVVAASNATRAGRTCRPAMGFSFAAGTTDGARPCACALLEQSYINTWVHASEAWMQVLNMGCISAEPMPALV